MANEKTQHPYWDRFKFHFVRSNYITAVWNWFLGLAGKAAEAVLTASVVYSCARLLPGINPPYVVDNTVFICQMVALDVGGLSLRKMANQARKDGNPEGADFAKNVSNWLIGIMIANVVLSVVQRVTTVPGQAIAVVEGLLLIGRAVMAVLYAHVIHSLKADAPPDPQNAPHPQPDITGLQEQMANQTSELNALRDGLNQLQNASFMDIETVKQSLTEHLNTQMKHLAEQPVEHETKQQNTVSTKHETGKNETAKQTKHLSRNTKKIVPIPTRNTDETAKQNTREAVYALLDADITLGPRELARRLNTGVSPATTKRHRDAYLMEQEQRNGTVD